MISHKRVTKTFIILLESVVTLFAFAFACFPFIATEYFGLSENFPIWSWNLVRFYIISLCLLTFFVLVCLLLVPESFKPITKPYLPKSVYVGIPIIKLFLLVISGHIFYSIVYGACIFFGEIFRTYVSDLHKKNGG